MDFSLQNLRNKRLKLFDPGHTEEPTAMSPASDVSPSASIEEDAKFARELQAQLERDEKPASSKLFHPFPNQYTPTQSSPLNPNAPPWPPAHNKVSVDEWLADDEDLAWQLQENYGFNDLSKNFGDKDISMLSKLNDKVSNFHNKSNLHNLGKAGLDEAVQQAQALSGFGGLFNAARRKHKISKPDVSYTETEAQEIDGSNNAVAVQTYCSTRLKVFCKNAHPVEPLDMQKLLQMFNDFLEGYPTDYSFLINCDACECGTCLGCGTTISSSSLEYGATAYDGRHLMWHCEHGRLAFIWFLLCGYDHKATHNKARVIQPRKAQSSTKPPRHLLGYQARHGSQKQKLAKGVGYAPDDEYYDDYSDEEYDGIDPLGMQKGKSAFAGKGYDLNGNITPPVSERVEEGDSPSGDPDDMLTAQSLSALSALLPSKSGALITEFDMEPPEIIRSMLLRSSILDRTADLLRNDSLEDASSRYALYDNVLHFIHTIACDSVMAQVLYADRQINKAGHNLLKVSFLVPTRKKHEKLEYATPLALCMANLNSQSNMVLRNAQNNQTVFETEEGQQLLLMCNHIVECNELLETATAKGSGKGKAAVPVTADPDAWQKGLAVLDVPDEEILATHYSAKDAQKIQQVQPGRMRHLLKEITILQTSLPPGIFVRHGESRLDVMKILIVGPKDTPYENGLFEFDLFCPEAYPNAAPQMHIKTTGGGRHRFNPNLYADGKVCLSLLNTWQGQQWTPGQSTILQVLVSIQAMIFCDEPHCNEPGFERDAGSEQSKEYSRNQYPAVIRYAMLEYLAGERKVTPPKIDYAKYAAENALPPPPAPAATGTYDFGPTPSTPSPHPPSNTGFSDLSGMHTLHPQSKTGFSHPPGPQSLHPPSNTGFSKFSSTNFSNPQNTAAPPDYYFSTLPSATNAPSIPLPKSANYVGMNDFNYVAPGAMVPAAMPPHHFYPSHRPGYKRDPAPVDKSNMWSEIVKKHFAAKENEIMQTVCRWLNDKSAPGASRRGRGRRLADSEPLTVAGTGEHNVAELKAKGVNLTAQLKAALEMFPSRGRDFAGFPDYVE